MNADFGEWAEDHGLELVTLAAFVFPGVARYLQWPLLALYALSTILLVHALRRAKWIVDMRDNVQLRLSHGLEHATIEVLRRDGAPVYGGFANRGYFGVTFAKEVDAEKLPEQARDAAQRAIDRIQTGESWLAYHPGCGTCDDVGFVLLFGAVATIGGVLQVAGAPTEVAILGLTIALRGSHALELIVGLAAQRWFTVSTEFESATIRGVYLVDTSKAVDFYMCTDDLRKQPVIKVEVDIVPRSRRATQRRRR